MSSESEMSFKEFVGAGNVPASTVKAFGKWVRRESQGVMPTFSIIAWKQALDRFQKRPIARA